MAPPNQGRIFISYRRQETAWPARQLYEVLVARFGAESVFKDVDDIDPGDDFVERITEAVASCNVLLALIGSQWVTMTDTQGRRRLDNPDDFVRLEVEAALARGVRVVPVLVDGAAMPRPDQLPPSMVALTRRQAVEISPTAFNPERLLLTLAAALAPPAPVPPVPAAAAAPVPPVPAAAAAPPAVTSPATPDLPSTIRREHSAAGAPGTAPARPPGTAPARAPRRWLVPVAAAVALILLGAGLLVLRPWAPAVPAAADRPSPSASTSASPSGPASSASPTTPPVAEGPLVLAHRGGLEQHQFETQAAMESAAEAGFSIETDVRYTSDGVAVLVHDEQATKGLDCGGREVRVSQTTWDDLSRWCRSKPTAKDPRQYPVPRLDPTLEAIAAASGTAQVFLEVKTELDDARRAQLLATPRKYGLGDRTVFTSLNRDWLSSIGDAEPETRRMLFVSGEPVPADSLADDGLWAVAVEQDLATQEYVDELKAIGVKVMIWNVNDADQWATVMAYQPDILMTDYPAAFTDWLSKR